MVQAMTPEVGNVPPHSRVHKISKGWETIEVFGFLASKANAEVAAVHPNAMTVILTMEEEREVRMKAPLGRGQGAAAPPAGRVAARSRARRQAGSGGGGWHLTTVCSLGSYWSAKGRRWPPILKDRLQLVTRGAPDPPERLRASGISGLYR